MRTRDRLLPYAWLVPFTGAVVADLLGYGRAAGWAFRCTLILMLAMAVWSGVGESRQQRRDRRKAREADQRLARRPRPEKGETPRRRSWWRRRVATFRDWPEGGPGL